MLTFSQKLNLAILEATNLPPRIATLAALIQQVTEDLSTTLVYTELSPPTGDDIGEANFEVTDAEGTILWLRLVYRQDGKIAYYDILAAPAQGQDWDFVDLEIGYPYADFLDDVSDLELEPPARDYGLDILNIIAWVIYAHQQIVAREQRGEGPDLDNLYEAGYYKVRATIADSEHGQATLGYWLEATSSEDARQQLAAMVGDRLIGKPQIIQFQKEEPDYS
jgi:hypothetical protein